MEEIKQLTSDDVHEQIKDSDHRKWVLMPILKYGLCDECKQPNTYYYWCPPCMVKRFQPNFKNWTSGNDEVDKFIQESQLKAESHLEVLEWIEYDSFENIEYLARGGFGTVFKAIWKDGRIIKWDSNERQLKRDQQTEVALKCLHNNSQDITAEFLSEVRSFL
jgi:hypothetical protein